MLDRIIIIIQRHWALSAADRWSPDHRDRGKILPSDVLVQYREILDRVKPWENPQSASVWGCSVKANPPIDPDNRELVSPIPTFHGLIRK